MPGLFPEKQNIRGHHELTFPAPEERYIFDREVVVFSWQDGESRVCCEISQEALDDHFGGDGKDQLTVFKANRLTIEQESRRKYLAGRREADGSVLSAPKTCEITERFAAGHSCLPSRQSQLREERLPRDEARTVCRKCERGISFGEQTQLLSGQNLAGLNSLARG